MKIQYVRGLVLVGCGIVASAASTQSHASTVALPFSDAFSDTVVGPWVQNNGAFTHDGSSLNIVSGSGVGGASVEIPTLGGGSNVGFTASVVVAPTDSGPRGFGLLSGDSDFGAANNSYYLVDIAPDAGGQIRIAQIDINGGGGVTLGDTGLQTAPLTYSNDEVYTLSVVATYGVGGLTLAYTVTSDGGDNVNLQVVDSTALIGTHFGIETFGASTTNFDNFTIVPEPSSLALLAIGGLLAVRRRRA